MSRKPFIKPNYLPIGTFTVTINDGWVAYRFKVPRQSHTSIDTLAKRIRKELPTMEKTGEIVWLYSDSTESIPRER